MRHALIATAALVAALVLAPRVAAAQHCHIPEVDGNGGHHHHHAGWWLRASTSAIAGSADLVGDARDYEGLAAAVQLGTHRTSARLAVPVYRVAEAGVGLGDISASGTVELLPHDAPLRAGLSLGLTLPSGSADDGRGMGHVMVAGGPWLHLERGRLRALASVSLATAIGGDAEHLAHRHGATDGWPLVDPMNPRELVTIARATAVLVPGGLDAGAQVTYAAPVMLEGEPRVVGGFLAERRFGRYGLLLLVEAPVVGDPFVARGSLELSYRFPT